MLLLNLYSYLGTMKDLGNYRKSYEKSALMEEAISANPMELFQKWFYEVEASEGVEEPNAMTISTIGVDGFPKNRVVLLKKYTHEGFIFYTNYESEKGLRHCIPLHGRFSVPRDCLFVVLFHTLTVGVHGTKVALRRWSVPPW